MIELHLDPSKPSCSIEPHWHTTFRVLHPGLLATVSYDDVAVFILPFRPDDESSAPIRAC